MACTRLTVLLAACLLCSAQQQPPTFRAGATLIEFTLIAVDGSGKPVTDLKPEETSITDQGKPREVAIFRFEGSTETHQPPALTPGLFTNRPEYTPGQPRNITAIVLDSLNTELVDQMSVRAQVMHYLRTVAPDTRVAVYRIGERLEVLHDFTDDIDSLRARLSQTAAEAQIRDDVDTQRMEAQLADMLTKVLSPEGGAMLRQAAVDMLRVESFYQDMMQERMNNLTLAALEALGNHLAGIPGRKSLVWISGGIPTIVTSSGWLKTYDAAIRRTAQRMASQGITVYPVDARALKTGTDLSRQTAPGSKPTQSESLMALGRQRGLASLGRLWASMDILAEVTGGRVSRNTNDLARGARLAAADVRGAYSIGFYAPGDFDNKWHRLNVKVSRPGVKLAYRQGYQSGAPEGHSPDWPEQDWRAVIANPIGSTAIRLDARCEPAPNAEAGAYDLLLQIASGDLSFRKRGDRTGAEVDIVVAEKTREGQASFRVWKGQLSLPSAAEAMPKAFSYRQGLTIQPSTWTIRLIVRDRSTDRYGALDLPVKSIPSTKN